MSVKDYAKVIQIEDTTTGEIISCLSYEDFSYETINSIIVDYFWKMVMRNEHGISLKLGYKK